MRRLLAFAARCAGLRFLVAAVIVPVFAAGAAHALPFTNLIVFGDSIVDQGNTQAAAIGAGFPDPAPASAGYFGGRFTNGINPADVLNQEIEGTNSVGSLFGGDNFAFGGARARNDGDFLPDLAAQTVSFLTRAGSTPIEPSTLIMINVGGNDVRDILLGGLAGAARQAVIDAAAAAVSTSIGFLQSAGAQHFLFVGVGNVGGIPELAPFGPQAAAAGRQASIDINAAIQAVLPSNAYYFDTIAWSDQLLANPALFGLPAGLDTTTACLGSGAPAPGGAPTCDDFAFFDTVHPTTQVLQLLGGELISVVPEPGTGILMMIGLTVLASRRPARAA